MELQRKQLVFSDVSLKMGPKGAGRLMGYASTWGNVDRQGDVVLPGAFKDSIDFFVKTGFIAQGHDHAGLPLATIDVAREDDMGLWVEADFHSTPEAQTARTVTAERIDRGKSVALSIGYTVPQDGSEFREDGVRLLKSIDVYEASLANIPANPLALVAGVKQALGTDAETFNDRLDALATEAQECTGIAQKRHDIRTKAGRRFSSASRDKIRSAAQALLSLLEEDDAEAQPPEKAATAIEQGKPTPPKPIAVGRPSVELRARRRRLAAMEAWATTHTQKPN